MKEVLLVNKLNFKIHEKKMKKKTKNYAVKYSKSNKNQ